VSTAGPATSAVPAGYDDRTHPGAPRVTPPPLDLEAFIRPVPDFPKPGILFRDITPLLADGAALAAAITRLVEPWRDARLDAVAAVEARGFLFATPLALELVYARTLYGERIAKASVDEMLKVGFGTPAQHAAWLEAMKRVFPDVSEGTQLVGIYQPGGATRFLRDGQPVGEIADPEFGKAFFAIWLHTKTSAPKLRLALFGMKP